MRAPYSPLISNRRGAGAAEFALVLPLLLLLLFGIIQYGVMFFVYNNMSNAAREGARGMAVGELTEAQAKTRVNNMLIDWARPNPESVTWIITAQDTGTTGTNQVRVVVTVPGSKASILSFAPGPATIRADVFMRKEI